MSYPEGVLVRVGANLEHLAVCAVGLEQTGILGAKEESPLPIEVARFERPVLLTDNARIARLPSTRRDAVIALYQSYPRQVEYDSVSTSWTPSAYPHVWCPSIDTIFFARTLKRFLTDEVQVCAELGCGSGFLTKFMLAYGQAVKKVVATDISLDAVRCTADNLQGVAGKEKVHLILPDPSAEDLALEGTYDLVVSNPPYIPRPFARRDNPYEGLDLVARVAKRAKVLLKEGGHVLLNLSSLAGDEPLMWFQEQGLQVEALEEMRVPLKVNPVTSGLSAASRQWRDYLEEQGRVEIDEDEASGYRYWHTLRMFSAGRKAK